MKQLKLMSLVMLMSASIYGADNEIYIDQSGATANIDLEQLGSGNIMGGLNSVAGTLTALDLDGLKKLYKILNDFRALKKTIIIASHDQNILKSAGIIIDLSVKPIPRIGVRKKK